MALCAEELSLRATVETFREEFNLSEFGSHTETYFASAPKAWMSGTVLMLHWYKDFFSLLQACCTLPDIDNESM